MKKKQSEVELIAEIGSVHDGSFGNALKLIDLAKECGASTVKFQTHIAEAETLKSAPSPSYFSSENRFDYFKRTSFTEQQWSRLIEHAQSLQLGIFSSPFSLEAVDLLESVGMPAYKIASGEVTNLPLLERLVRTGKKIYLSSGMSSWKELDAAVEVFKGKCELLVFQCTSAYPCTAEQVGLNVISEIKERYNVQAGLSDHTEGNAAAIAAVALGATAVEKHLTFSKKMYGSDAKNAAEPAQFQALAAAINEVAQMLDNPVDKADNSSFIGMKEVFEKSIVSLGPIRRGDRLTLDNIGFKKPGTGIPASSYKEVLGRKASRDLAPDSLIMRSDYE